MCSVGPLVAPIAGELVPGQGQSDEALPVGTFGGRGPLHRGLGFALWIVLTHEADTLTRSAWRSGRQFRPYDCGDFLVARADSARSVNCVTAGARRLR